MRSVGMRWLLLIGLMLVMPLTPAASQGSTEWGILPIQHGAPPRLPQGLDLKIVRGDFPHLTVSSIPRHLLAWDVGQNLASPTREILQEIENSRELDLPLVILRVDLPSLSVDRKRNDLSRVRELVNAADNLNRQFILALELDWAPEWYVRSDLPLTVMVASSANLNDDQKLGLGGSLTGPLRHLGRGAAIAPGDAEYLEICKAFLADLHNEFRNHPRFIGWVLSPPSAPLCYPGLGRDGVGGLADYSAASVKAFDPAQDYWRLMEERESTLLRRDVFATGGAFQGTPPGLLMTPDEVLEGTLPDQTVPESTLPMSPDLIEPALPDVAVTDEGSESAPLPASTPALPPGPAIVAPASGEVVVGFRNGPPEPLPPGSKSGPDDRAIWRKWTQFRVYALQQRFDALATKLRSLDQQHPIFATSWGALAYRDHNGYEVMGAGLDPVWLARHPMVDGLIVPLALSSRTFALPSGIGDSDNLNSVRGLTRLAQRYNKLSIVSVEKHPTAPPRLADIAALQQWCVATGTDPWWTSNGFFTSRSHWNEQERQEIARGVPYGALPFPSRRIPAPVTILDSPLLLANSYADVAPRMSRAAHLADIFTACGVDFELVFPQEFPAAGGGQPSLGEATYLLHGDLLGLYDPFTVGFQTAIAQRNRSRQAENLPPFPLRYLDDVRVDTWYLNGYASRPLRDNLLTELARSGIKSRLRNGPPSLMEMNDTYVFYRALRSGPGRAPELFLLETQDPAMIRPLASVDFYSLSHAQEMPLKLNNGFADFSLIPNSPGEGPVLLGRPERLGSSRMVYAEALRRVIHNQQYAAMRQSLPWILLLSLSAIALGLLFVYQLNVSRKGGLRLYLLRRQQAALDAAIHGKTSIGAVGGAQSVRRFAAAGAQRQESDPHRPLLPDPPELKYFQDDDDE